MRRYIELALEEELAILTLNRESKLNAMNRPMMEELKAAISELKANEEIRAIILTGKGKSFSAGADITEMQDLNPQTGIEFISSLHELMAAVRQLDKPVIAGVNGYCFGGALELAISCDLLIASENASFGMQEVNVGIPSVIEAALFPFMVGLAKTREMLYTGNVIPAAEARSIGLVNAVVEPDALLGECRRYARQITRNPAHTVSLQKKLINRWLEFAGLEQSVKAGIDYFGLSFTNPETNNRLRNAMKK